MRHNRLTMQEIAIEHASPHRVGGKPFAWLLFVPALAGAAPAIAQVATEAFPARPVRIIVPYPPGGVNDIIARLVGGKFVETFGHQAVIDNRPGSAGNVGAGIAARASADGHTLLMGGAGTLTISPSLYRKLPFDTLRDFAPLARLASLQLLLVVHPSLPVASVPELVAHARAHPGRINYASPGSGTPSHLASELFRRSAGFDWVHVPYKGGAPALTDLLAGQVQATFDNMPVSLPHVRAGKLRGLATSGAKRAAAVPDIPTVAESGLPGFEVIGWWGLFAPAATPRAALDRLESGILRISRAAEIAERLVTQGFDHAVLDSREFRASIEQEIVKWARVVKESGARAD